MRMMRALLLVSALLTAALSGQGSAPPGGAAGSDPSAALRAWLIDYKAGAVRFQKGGLTDSQLVEDVDRMMAAVAARDTFANARLLFEVAVAAPAASAGATDPVAFQREVQPWRVQQMAQRHLGTMRAPTILPWLLKKLRAKGLRASAPNEDQRHAVAVLKVLAGHPSLEAKLELVRACGSMPNAMRVHSVIDLYKDAVLDLAPTLVDLLRDREPNVRIAACNALGAALRPHVDETESKAPTGELLKQRDLVIDRVGALLRRDNVWQVRSAAAFALAELRCKAVIPVLIAGLDAELKRTKDPGARDVRLHKLLEGLTGQSVARGGAAPWKAFWKQEGASFKVRPKPKPGEEPAQDSRYDKFFDLTIESDRVLFVLDFSGSMAEPAELRAEGTRAGGAAANQTTKAKLVVEEIKKLVMSLPDGALCNFVVFSEDVRIWRAEGSRPALVKLDDDARDELVGSFLDGLRPQGPTNLYDALEAALGFGGRGLYDQYYAAGFDTLYVITDGAPTAGPVTDKEEIRARVREANQLRKIAIHCITFGDQNDTAFLKPLAEENGGRHIHVQ